MYRVLPLLYGMLKGLRVLPRVYDTFYRGIDVKPDESKYPAGRRLVWHPFTSTTTMMDVVKRFLSSEGNHPKGVIFIINGWGYDIAPLSFFSTEHGLLPFFFCFLHVFFSFDQILHRGVIGTRDFAHR